MEQQALFKPINRENQISFFALTYFRRILNFQCLKLIVRNFSPISKFFETDPDFLRQFFLDHMDFLAFSQADWLLDQKAREEAFSYGRRIQASIESSPSTSFLMANDPDFPRKLRTVSYPVDWIFQYGASKNNQTQSVIAVVGTRRCTKEGIENTRLITSTLVENQFIIISGLAEGIDSEAHKATLAKNGYTHAVLGTGINKIFPKNNASLLKDILNHGGRIYSEFLPDVTGNRTSFIMRNRIIAALSDVIIAVEGQAPSGTAHTIKFGAEMGKKLIGIKTHRNQSLNQLIENYGGKIFSTSELDNLLAFLEERTDAH